MDQLYKAGSISILANSSFLKRKMAYLFLTQNFKILSCIINRNLIKSGRIYYIISSPKIQWYVILFVGIWTYYVFNRAVHNLR